MYGKQSKGAERKPDPIFLVWYACIRTGGVVVPRGNEEGGIGYFSVGKKDSVF